MEAFAASNPSLRNTSFVDTIRSFRLAPHRKYTAVKPERSATYAEDEQRKNSETAILAAGAAGIQVPPLSWDQSTAMGIVGFPIAVLGSLRSAESKY
jgi:hypothetical protein